MATAPTLDLSAGWEPVSGGPQIDTSQPYEIVPTLDPNQPVSLVGGRARVTVYNNHEDQYGSESARKNPLTGKRQSQEGVTIAVDPKVIPYGSRVKIPALAEMSANKDGVFIAHDTGGAVKSRKASGGKEPVIDVYVAGQNRPEANARMAALDSAIAQMSNGSGNLDFELLDPPPAQKLDGDTGTGRIRSGLSTFAQTAEAGLGKAVEGLGTLGAQVVSAVQGTGTPQEAAAEERSLRQIIAKAKAAPDFPQKDARLAELEQRLATLGSSKEILEVPAAIRAAGRAVVADAEDRFTPNPAYAGEFFAETVPQVAGSAVQSVAPFLVPGVGPALGTAQMFAQTYQDTYEKNRAKGVDEEEAIRRGLLNGIVSGGLEPIGGGIVAGAMKKLAAGKAAQAAAEAAAVAAGKKIPKSAKRLIAEGTLGEGVTGAAQETASQIISKDTFDPMEIAKAGALEALGGFMMTGTAAGVGRLAKRYMKPVPAESAGQEQPANLAGISVGATKLTPEEEALFAAQPQQPAAAEQAAPVNPPSQQAQPPPQQAAPVQPQELDPDVLAAAATHTDPGVRLVAAWNVNTPGSVLSALQNDPDPYVREAAALTLQKQANAAQPAPVATPAPVAAVAQDPTDRSDPTDPTDPQPNEQNNQAPLTGQPQIRPDLPEQQQLPVVPERPAPQTPQANAASAAPAEPAAPVAPPRKPTQAELAEAAYRAELQAELDAVNEEHTVGLADALRRIGGLPSKKSRHFGEWSGELAMLIEERQGARKRFGNKRLFENLFDDEARSMDTVAEGLREEGFDVAGADDVFRLVDQWMRTNKEPRAALTNIGAEESMAGMPFSKQTGTADTPALPPGVLTQAKAAVKSLFSRAGMNPATVWHASPDGIPAGVGGDLVRAEAAAGRAVEGFFLGGRVHLVASGIAQGAAQFGIPFETRAQQVALHETVGHDGLGAVLAAKSRRVFNSIVDGVYTRIPKAELSQIARDYQANLATPQGRADVVTEYLARQTEPGIPSQGIVARAIAKIRELLREVFPKLRMTDGDIVALLNAARRRVAKRSQPATTAEPIRFSKVPTQEQTEAAAATPEKRRGHVETVRRMLEVTPDVKSAVESFYRATTAKEVNDRAAATIDAKGVDQALSDYLASTTADDNAMAMGHHLAQRLQTMDRRAEATMVRKKMAESLTSPARALWYISTIAKTDQEGIMRYAETLTAEGAADMGPELKAAYENIAALQAELAKVKRKLGAETILEIQDYLRSLKLTPERLTELNTKLRDALVLSPENPGNARNKIVGMLVNFGMEHKQATKLAEQAIRQFTAKAKKVRESLIKKMLAGVKARKERVPKTVLEKLMLLNNEGKLTDETLHAEIAKALGVPVFTKEAADRIEKLQKEYEDAPDGPVKMVKGAQMLEAVHELVPTEIWSKVRAIQNISMLLSGKTIARNVLGNVGMFIVNGMTDTVNSVIWDPAIHIFTGKHVSSSAALAARIKGLGEPFRVGKAGWQFAAEQGLPTGQRLSEALKTVIHTSKMLSGQITDPRQLTQQYRHTFSSRFARLFEDGLALTLGAPDLAFWGSGYQASLARQMATSKANGVELLAPTQEMQEEALLDAGQAIFQNENVISATLKRAQETLRLPRYKPNNPKGQRIVWDRQFGLGDALIKFTQVPGAIALQGLKISPFGAINVIQKARLLYKATQGQEKQVALHRFIQAMSQFSIGLGATAVGYWFSRLGIITGPPDEDPDVEALRRSMGVSAYQFNWSEFKRRLLSWNWTSPAKPHEAFQDGDTMLPYSWAQPAAMPLMIGAALSHHLDKASQKGKEPFDVLLHVVENMGDMQVRQPMMAGINQFMRDSTSYGPLEAVVRAGLQMPSAFVPAVVSQTQQFINNSIPETRGGGVLESNWNKFQAKIPFLGNKFPAKLDAFGQAVERYNYGGNGFLNVWLNPVTIIEAKRNPAANEMMRLYDATGKPEVVAPIQRPKVNVNGQPLQLTNEQIVQMQSYTGQLAAQTTISLMASPVFVRLPDEYKAKVIAQVLGGIQRAAKIELLGQVPFKEDQITQEMARLGRERGLVPRR